MKNPGTKRGQTDSRVLVSPARMVEIEGGQVYFLFSVRQVAEVLKHVKVQPVPFSPPYVEGVAEWCGRLLPVLSLEHCLGVSVSDERMPLRAIVVRGVSREGGNQPGEMYAICQVGADIRQTELPLACEPAAVPDWVTDASCLHGVYQMQTNFFLVINIEAILSRKKFE